MALHNHKPRNAPVGRETPRVAPPSPLRSLAPAYVLQAEEIGIELMPWQRTVLHYLCAIGPDDRWMYPETAAIVSRQNGKSKLLVPLIVKRLREGRRIIHTAQNRELPRIVFGQVASVMVSHYGGELARSPRFANGQEEILTMNGGSYRIVAPTRGGARGLSADDILVDELREMEDFEFIAAAEPALAASANPQIIYVSNAGTDESKVLNALRDRAASDPALCYLEWSAAPDRSADDREGWLEANPAIGFMPGMWDYLERKHRSYALAHELGIFETEHLCRWVHHILPPIIKPETWATLQGETTPPYRPALGLSLDPTGQRASAVLAWQEEGRVAVRCIADVTGDPIDLDAFGADLKMLAREYKVKRVGFDGATDRELAKYFKSPEVVTGAQLTNASSLFVTRTEGQSLVWDGEDYVGPDIPWTGRKTHDQPGTWTAVKLSEDHPVTAMLATIRAVWLASGPVPKRARVH